MHRQRSASARVSAEMSVMTTTCQSLAQVARECVIWARPFHPRNAAVATHTRRYGRGAQDATAFLLLTFCGCCKRRRARDIVRANGSVCRSFQDHLECHSEW